MNGLAHAKLLSMVGPPKFNLPRASGMLRPALHVSLCPIVNFVSHVIQSGSDPDGFVQRVKPG